MSNRTSALLAGFAEELQNTIVRNSHSRVALIGEITRYLLGGGKRVRARLVWLVGNLFADDLSDEQKARLLELGCAIECIHLATLMHDDVIDQSLLRRGQQAVHLRWGTAEAVLVGDFVYSRAFEILVNMGNLHLLELTARATNQLAEGEVEQLVDVHSASRSEEDYYRVIEKKTAALFACACACAASIAGADRRVSEDLYQLGLGVGMAFQIIDDLIDYTGKADGMGKRPGDDYREGKYTLPLILLLRQADARQREHILRLVADPGDKHFADLLGMMRQRDIFSACQQLAASYLAPAQQALHALPESEARELLLAELDGFLHRAA